MDLGIMLEPRPKCRVRKRSRPLSEANPGRIVTAIPEDGVLDNNKEKNEEQVSVNCKINRTGLWKTIEDHLTDEIINTEDMVEASRNGFCEDSKSPEDTEELSCVESPHFNRVKRRTDVTFEEHDFKRRVRYGVLSASFCDEDSLEDLYVGRITNFTGLPRPMSVIDGIDEMQMKSGNLSRPYLAGSRLRDSRVTTALNHHTSVSIPTGLDRINNSTFVLQSKKGIAAGDRPSMIHWGSCEAEIMEDGEVSHRLQEENDCSCVPILVVNSIKPIFVEALWDHVTMDEEELSFRVGDVIRVKDMSDSAWWWGELEKAEGWFPASFVRILVNQLLRKDSFDNSLAYVGSPGDTTDSKKKVHNVCNECGLPNKTASKLKLTEACTCPLPRETLSSDIRMTSAEEPDRVIPCLSKWHRMRSNVVKEILNSEKEFLKQLKDVVEGYINRCRKRQDLFSEECLAIIFGNIEQIYEFERSFLSQLEDKFNHLCPHESDIGTVFLNNRENFEIYSEYCNNHPRAMARLMELFSLKEYRHFFETCRLLQKMIDISIDGFLLTPIQKICKYPLQLGELLKYTQDDDGNYGNIQRALGAMKDVAKMINDRKRQIENIEKITIWQKNIINWQGADVLEKSSELILSGEFYTLFYTKSKPQLRVGFLFDNQLILCKKDILRKDLLYYKYRFDLSDSIVTDIDEFTSRDGPMSLSSVGSFNGKHWWKIQSLTTPLCAVMFCKREEDKQKWLRAFKDEKLIREDENRKAMSLNEDVKKEIVEKTALRYNNEKENARLPLHISYRERMKMIQRPALHSNKSNSFLSNITFKLTPFRKNSRTQSET